MIFLSDLIILVDIFVPGLITKYNFKNLKFTIMKKLYVVFLILFLGLVVIYNLYENLKYYKLNTSMNNSDSSNDCLENVTLTAKYWNGEENVDQIILNKDCPERTTFYLTLPENLCCNNYSLTFNGKEIKLKNTSILNYNFYDGYKPGEYVFKFDDLSIFDEENDFMIEYSCNFESFDGNNRSSRSGRKRLPLKIVQNGDRYGILKSKIGVDSTKKFPFATMLTCNNNIGEKSTYNFINAHYGKYNDGCNDSFIWELTVEKLSPKINGKGNIWSQITFSPIYNVTFEPFLNVFNSDKTSQLKIDPPNNPGKCYEVCGQFFWEIGKYDVYQVDCTNGDKKLNSEINFAENSIVGLLTPCNGEIDAIDENCKHN